MRPNVNVVTLCGSTRFLPEFQLAQRELAMQGLSVLTISQALDKEKGDDELPMKQLLDLVHFNHIIRSDAILVIARGSWPDNVEPDEGMFPYNYIGFSTSREIMWAYMQNKQMLDMSKYCSKDGTINELGSFDWRKLARDLRVGCTDLTLVERARFVLKLDGNAGSSR